jgi:hypothetical protein
MRTQLWGREPALVIAAIGAVLTTLAALNVPGIDAGAAAAITAFISACVIAWTTRPAAPALFTGVVTALAALLVEYGLNVSDGTVAAVSGTVLAGFALITRGQVEPKTEAVAVPQ